MELFYYCISAPKEEERHIHQYTPGYDQFDYHTDQVEGGGIPDSDSECTPEAAPTFEELNDSLHELELDPAGAAEGALSPVEEDPPLEPEEVEPEFGDNLLRRNNSRKFKTPSFKWRRSKKKKRLENLSPVSPSAPTMSPDTSLYTNMEPAATGPVIDLDSNLDLEDTLEIKQLEEKKISLDSLSDKLKDKEAVAVAAEETHDTERERLARELENLNRRLADAEDTIQRFQSDNRLLQQRVDISERERSAMQHGNYVELEKVREEYQSKLNDMALYREKLRTAEARGEDAETTSVALKSQLAQKNATIEELNVKIDTFQEQIGRLKEKFSSVSEDNIELANKAQSHEKKVMEADLHNKNLMDLVAQKDDTAEQHQPKAVRVEADAPLPPPPAAASPSISDNNASEGKGKGRKSGSSSSSSSSVDTSDEEPDWAELLKSAEANRERLGLNVDQPESDGESSVDEEGNRYVKKKSAVGLTGNAYLNRVATNQLLGYDEFGRPMGKSNGSMGMMGGGKTGRNRALLFGMDQGKRNGARGSNNKSSSERRSGGGARSGGRRNKGGKGTAMLLGF